MKIFKKKEQQTSVQILVAEMKDFIKVMNQLCNLIRDDLQEEKELMNVIY